MKEIIILLMLGVPALLLYTILRHSHRAAWRKRPASWFNPGGMR